MHTSSESAPPRELDTAGSQQPSYTGKHEYPCMAGIPAQIPLLTSEQKTAALA